MAALANIAWRLKVRSKFKEKINVVDSEKRREFLRNSILFSKANIFERCCGTTTDVNVVEIAGKLNEVKEWRKMRKKREKYVSGETTSDHEMYSIYSELCWALLQKKKFMYVHVG
jgi:hypothetical protein